jgi:hypothetical protein
MRKLSLFILAAGATMGVSLAQADDVTDAGTAVDAPDVQVYLPPEDTSGEAVDPVPEVHVDPMPGDTGETSEPVFVVEDIDLPHPREPSVELINEGGDGETEVVTADDTAATDDTAGTDDTATTDDTAGTDDTATTDDTAGTDDTAATEEKPVDDDTLMYQTSVGTVDPREGCMECRSLTAESSGNAVEAPAPEVMVDVLDGNATGVDVMDPVEGKKRSSH